MFSDKGDKESIDNILKTLGYDKGRENEGRAFYKGSTEIREENPKLDDSRRVRGRREEFGKLNSETLHLQEFI